MADRHADLIALLRGPLCLNAAVVEKRLLAAADALEAEAARVDDLKGALAYCAGYATPHADDDDGDRKRYLAYILSRCNTALKDTTP